MCSVRTVGDAEERLRERWQLAQNVWRETSAVWDDVVRRRFEKQFWSEYSRRTPLLLKEMEHLDDLIGQARRQVQ